MEEKDNAGNYVHIDFRTPPNTVTQAYLISTHGSRSISVQIKTSCISGPSTPPQIQNYNISPNGELDLGPVRTEYQTWQREIISASF
jgi:hypothetical protein